MAAANYVHTQGSQGTYSHRPIVWGTRGMVGGGTQLTAQTGMRILWQGGNAVDAAVASALAAGVMEPTAHYTLGGEVAFLFYDRSSKVVRSVVGQGWAPQRATIDHYMEKWGEIPSGVLEHDRARRYIGFAGDAFRVRHHVLQPGGGKRAEFCR